MEYGLRLIIRINKPNQRTAFIRGANSFLLDEKAQAMVEFILILTVVVSVVTVMSVVFRKGIRSLWVKFTREISAACPGCPPDSSIK